MAHGTIQEAFQKIEEALSGAANSDKFMVAVWYVDENGDLHTRRTTWNFPTVKFEQALFDLRKLLTEEPTPPPIPLPLAAFLGDKEDDREGNENFD